MRGRQKLASRDGYFSTEEAAKEADVNVSRLQYWYATKLIVPAVKSTGPGSRREYSLEDVQHIKFVARMRREGWTIKQIKDALRLLVSLRGLPNGSDPSELMSVLARAQQSAVLVHDEGVVLAIVRTATGEQVILDAVSAGRQGVLEIVLETLSDNTMRAIKADK